MIELDDLDVLIEDLSYEPSNYEIDLLFKSFKADFIENPFTIDGHKIKIIHSPSIIPSFKSYPETFVHIITRLSELSKKRRFEPDRANRIHWIKNILLQKNDVRIKFFQFNDENKVTKDYYWFEEKNFMIILKKVTNDLMIVTAFCVDLLEKEKYKKRFLKYRASIK